LSDEGILERLLVLNQERAGGENSKFKITRNGKGAAGRWR
jgi:hypothetical protein